MDHHLAFMSTMFPDEGGGGKSAIVLGNRSNIQSKPTNTSGAIVPKKNPHTMPASLGGGPTSPIQEEESTIMSQDESTLSVINPRPEDSQGAATEVFPSLADRMSEEGKPKAESNNHKSSVENHVDGKTGPRIHFDDFLDASAAARKNKSRNSSSGVRRSTSSFLRQHLTPRGRSRSRSMTHGRRHHSVENHLSLEEYVQKSSRVQSFLGNAWQHVKQAASNKDPNESHPSSSSVTTALSSSASVLSHAKKKKKKRHRSSVREGVIHEPPKDKIGYTLASESDGEGAATSKGTNRILREHTTEIWRLKRQLEQVQQEHLSLKSTHESIQRELISSQNRSERAQSELHVAAEKARTARADADAAEAASEHLAQQLNDLQTVVDETKKASQLLQEEQDQVEKKVAQAESSLHQKSLELTKARSKLNEHEAQQELFSAAKQAWEREHDALQNQLLEKERKLETLEREKHESDALANARLERLQKAQEEWSEAQSLLEEATQSKMETQQTVVQLSDTVTELTKANGVLHKQLSTAQAASHEQAMQQQAELADSEKTSLQLQIQNEELQEEITRSKKQIQTAKKQQPPPKKTSISESNSKASTPSNVVAQKTASLLPPLNAWSALGNTENNGENSTTGKCGICEGPSYGIMKRCQCGRKECKTRAHLTCANKLPQAISVSHPGTPAPRLPVVFCTVISKPKNTVTKPLAKQSLKPTVP